MHPRFKYYPFHKDYTAMGNEFRPFVTFTHVANYTSASVNTDKLGFRVQYDADGQAIDITTLKSSYKHCNLMMGNSTSFGVDASSDKKTISHYLQQTDIPCLNLSIRGGTTRQELITFLILKQYLPPIKNIIFFTGITNPSLAALDASLPHPEFGGVFSEPFHFQHYRGFYQPTEDHTYTLRKGFYEKVEEKYGKAGKLAKKFYHTLFRLFQKKEQTALTPAPALGFEEKMDMLLSQLHSDLQSWTAFREQMGFKLHFILQPSIGWTQKKLTPSENDCYSTDFKKHKVYYQRFVSQKTYTHYRDFLQKTLAQFNIDFYDANEWLNDKKFDEISCFTDVCHMTDEGNQIMADFIKNELQLA
ncbi:MAG TPA: hypothetical protein DCS93_44210 [Microscillaceae bacterium]|nr:hypothetical protein [Microscillaceae bacterium]